MVVARLAVFDELKRLYHVAYHLKYFSEKQLDEHLEMVHHIHLASCREKETAKGADFDDRTAYEKDEPAGWSKL